MSPRRNRCPIASAILVVLVAAGCERATTWLAPAPVDVDPLVFDDAFGPSVGYQAFLGSKVDAVEVDATEKAQGQASLRVVVPRPGDASGAYTGGAVTSLNYRDFSSFTALTFWAASSTAATLDVAGLGNDNTGTSRFEAKWEAIGLTATWKKYVIPIPAPARPGPERCLFFFAEGPEAGRGNTIWFDDVKFEAVGGITNPRPSIGFQNVDTFVGETVVPTGTLTTFNVNGLDQTIRHSPAYFDFRSSAESVALVDREFIRIVGPGTATVTAKLGQVAATGQLTINATLPPMAPAPAPTLPSGDVLSLFSDAYGDVPVNTWSAPWDNANVTDIEIAGNATKAYTSLVFAGIEFTNPTVDASNMTHFHMDVWAPQGLVFRVKLVDFGPNGAFGGGDDSHHELAFAANTTPAFVPGQWVALELELTSFANLQSRAHLAQLILSGDARTVYVDNVYFHK